MSIKSSNFNVDKYGNLSCNNADITGGYIGIPFKDRYDMGEANLGIIDEEGAMSTWVNGNGFHCKTDYAFFHVNCVDDIGITIGTEYHDITNITPSGITTPILTETSLEESKKNFEKLQNGLDIIKNTEIYKYNLKSQNDGEKKHIGLVIGEKYKYDSNITALDNEGKEVGVDTYSMISVAYKAIQELAERIQDLENKLKEEQ